jgi:hypothetical protein
MVNIVLLGQFGLPGVFELLIVAGFVLIPVVLIISLVRRKNLTYTSGKLAPCPDCYQPVSRRAQTCPHCGAPLKPSA